MKKILSILFIAFLLVACGSQKKADRIGQALDKVNKSTEIKMPKASPIQIAQDVAFLASDDLKGRDTGSEGIEKAAIYISERFQEMGVNPFKGSYMDDFQAKGTEAFNVVGVITGSDKDMLDEIVVIGAHYDHIGVMQGVQGDSIANGANDNATGTATVLAIAENFKKLEFNRRTVVFALFSAEEKGLIGSKHLAQRMKKEGMNVVAMINFEMTGTPMIDSPFITYVTGHDGSNMAAVFNEANEDVTVTGKLEKAAEFNLFMRSDNYPFFQEFNVPSQTFCTFDFTNFDHYHKVGDETSLVNTGHMANVVDAVMPGVFKVVNGEKLKLTPQQPTTDE
ncbi:peptidase M28-like protein [Nonlabens dokdonensis]|uniref:Peptidase M28-like protein n=2 Tax=Nonlabens dokdonensis TaxID=328515 RepID=A0ABX5PYR4_9FLAO|nr:M20/M25/M40 family metallo-hydrolase [Nonlabens dokdonensis]AGC77144.1 putative peptidase family M28 domain protein [Nonlabens dokdonensis DSW-6]PZX41103.1 peptidase M28-like protein [Nonlabens dokdonensis]